jgi:hypothetical protein
MNRRPNRKTIETIINWLHDQGISLYTGNADLETGQRDFGCMDIDTADEAISIYNRNKLKTWKDPIYP